MTPATVRIDGEGSSVVVATSFGPRIVALEVGGRNLFADLPDDVLEAGGHRYRLRGGHRLWAAPEHPPVTYAPDDAPCEVTPDGAGVRVEGPPDAAGLAKSLVVTPSPDGWTVHHAIRNDGSAPIELAPWAITQLVSGGRATMALGPPTEGFRADRAVVLWPYTDVDDSRLTIAHGGVSVDATPGPPLKVGVAGGPGTAAYEREGVRFSKRVSPVRDAPTADLGATVQVYANDRFVELETLGPLVVLGPGETATHREDWTIA